MEQVAGRSEGLRGGNTQSAGCRHTDPQQCCTWHWVKQVEMELFNVFLILRTVLFENAVSLLFVTFHPICFSEVTYLQQLPAECGLNQQCYPVPGTASAIREAAPHC